MIVDERMVTYIRSLEVPESAVIEAIEQEALRDRVPIIRKEMQSFLKVLLMIKRPNADFGKLGAAVGFSSILMSEYMPEGGHITTIENYDKRIPIARANFKRAGKEEQIDLIEGDALEVMHGLEGPYDLIFVDAAKGSTFITFRKLCGFLGQMECLCQIMCCRKVILLSPDSRWSAGIGLFTAVCGSISMSKAS